MHATRRRFLTLGAAALAGALTPRSLRAGPAPAGGIGLGFGLYGMKGVPLPEALAACARIGYQNVQLCLDKGFPAEPSQFSLEARKAAGRQMREAGLGLSAVMRNGNLFGTDALHAAYLEAIKASAQVIHDVDEHSRAPIESILGGKSEEWEQTKERAAERLRAWGDTAAAAGATLVVKAHAGQGVDSPERLLWLLRRADSPAIAIDYDHSHFELAGYTLEDSLRTLAPYTRFVTVKEARGTAKDPHYLLPGDGHTDFTHYFQLLRTVGYSGPVVVEVSAQIFSRKGYDPMATAQRCYEVLAPALRTAEAGA